MDSTPPKDPDFSAILTRERDHMADADAFLTRKRPRLTPPQYADYNFESHGCPVGSPLVVEITPPDTDNETPADIIILADDDLDVSNIESFPRNSRQQSPVQAAAQFAAICCDLDLKIVPSQKVEDFAAWVHDYVTATSAANDGRSYLENQKFWNHVGQCLGGLATRR